MCAYKQVVIVQDLKAIQMFISCAVLVDDLWATSAEHPQGLQRQAKKTSVRPRILTDFGFFTGNLVAGLPAPAAPMGRI
jgi:hypothetical protein